MFFLSDVRLFTQVRFSVSPEVVQLTAVLAGKSAVATPSVYLTDKTELKTFQIKIVSL